MNHIDVRIAFSEVVIESGNQPSVVRRANLVMSVPSFMAMAQLIAANAQVLMVTAPKQAADAQASIQELVTTGLAKLNQ